MGRRVCGGIDMPPKRLTKRQHAAIVRDFQAGYSTIILAKAWDVPVGTIEQIIRNTMKRQP